MVDGPLVTARLTDPRAHNPDDFCYLVHAVGRGIKSPLYFNRYVSASLIGRVPDSPVGLLENYSVFGSDGTRGVVLEVREENVLAAWPEDIASGLHNPDWVRRVAAVPRERRIKPWYELLRDGKQWNEVVVRPERVSAVFLQEGAPYTSEKWYSEQDSLPLVRIPKPNFTAGEPSHVLGAAEWLRMVGAVEA